MKMERRSLGKILKRVVLTVLCVIGLLSIMYIFILPGYVKGQLENVKRVVVSQGEIDALVFCQDLVQVKMRGFS